MEILSICNVLLLVIFHLRHKMSFFDTRNPKIHIFVKKMGKFKPDAG